MKYKPPRLSCVEKEAARSTCVSGTANAVAAATHIPVEMCNSGNTAVGACSTGSGGPANSACMYGNADTGGGKDIGYCFFGYANEGTQYWNCNTGVVATAADVTNCQGGSNNFT